MGHLLLEEKPLVFNTVNSGERALKWVTHPVSTALDTLPLGFPAQNYESHYDTLCNIILLSDCIKQVYNVFINCTSLGRFSSQIKVLIMPSEYFNGQSVLRLELFQFRSSVFIIGQFPPCALWENSQQSCGSPKRDTSPSEEKKRWLPSSLRRR